MFPILFYVITHWLFRYQTIINEILQTINSTCSVITYKLYYWLIDWLTWFYLFFKIYIRTSIFSLRVENSLNIDLYKYFDVVSHFTEVLYLRVSTTRLKEGIINSILWIYLFNDILVDTKFYTKSTYCIFFFKEYLNINNIIDCHRMIF